MNENKRLMEAYHQTAYPVLGNGKRTVQMLQDAMEHLHGTEVSDLYGTGALIEDFQQKMADYLGKDTAVFFPSGTMAQQIAMRIWCDQQGVKRVAYHPLCHLEIHEEEGLRQLHHIEPVLLADKYRLIRLDDLTNMREKIACLLLELPQREIGGELPEYQELEAISAYCRKNGIKLHLDGARLFEVLPYYQKTAAEVCKLFDSVYVSFYKGIGGIAGAILAGNESFTTESKKWKRRHGGDLISLYPYIISADFYFEQRKDSFPAYHEAAKELAGLYNECHAAATRPLIPVSNMFHARISLAREQLEPILLAVYEETGVGLTNHLVEKEEGSCTFEVSIGDRYASVPKDALQKAFQLLNAKLKEAVRE